SPSRWMYGGWCTDPKALPSAWTTPLLPSDSSYSAHRSRSRSACIATARPRLLPQPENCLRTCQFRFTRMTPDVPPCLVRETEGACLVSVTLVSRTGAGGGGGTEGAGAPYGAAGDGGAYGEGGGGGAPYGEVGGGAVTGGATGGAAGAGTGAEALGQS